MLFSRVNTSGLEWRVLSAVAVVATGVARVAFGASWARTAVLFLSVEGTALLACSIQPDRATFAKGWRTWFDAGLAGATAFVPFLFWAGLLMLAMAAFLSAVVP